MVVEVDELVDDTDTFPFKIDVPIVVNVVPIATFPAIYVFPWIPTPPITCNAPVVVDVDELEDIIVTFPYADNIVPTETLPPTYKFPVFIISEFAYNILNVPETVIFPAIYVFPWIPTPPDT